MLTVTDWFMHDGQDRRLLYPADYAQCFGQGRGDGLGYLTDLLGKVNAILELLGVSDVVITGGWGPPSLHLHAPHSGHINGQAVDLRDRDASLWHKIAGRPDYLKERELWLEAWDPKSPHVHIDSLMRADRPTRVFHP